jgi:glycosyltransferase involved in cell wall biosynthesis
MKNFSVVIPVYNEVENIVRVYDEIIEVQKRFKYNLEIIFINDGSNDGTLEVLKTLEKIKIFSFDKNQGQTAAISEGIKLATHPYIFTMDGDGQNDPNDFEKLIGVMKSEKLDLVVGWRHVRKDKIMKRIISKGAYILRRIIFKDLIHDSGCSLKLFNKNCLLKIDLFSQMHRFIPILMKNEGFRVGEVKVNHRERYKGQTKYNLKRLNNSIIDIVNLKYITKYSKNPLYAFGKIGINFIIIGICIGFFVMFCWLKGIPIPKIGLISFMTFLFVSSINFFCLGLILDKVEK